MPTIQFIKDTSVDPPPASIAIEVDVLAYALPGYSGMRFAMLVAGAHRARRSYRSQAGGTNRKVFHFVMVAPPLPTDPPPTAALESLSVKGLPKTSPKPKAAATFITLLRDRLRTRLDLR